MEPPEAIKNASPAQRSPRAVTTRLVATVFLSVVGMTAILSLMVVLLVRIQLRDTVPLELEAAAVRIAAQIDRDTAERLRELQSASVEIQLGSAERTAEWKRTELENLRDRMGFAWVGFAHENGAIAVATDSLLERSSAFRFPWFRGGLAGPYVGEVHPVAELEESVGAESRFLPYATPVKDSSQRVIGVLCGELEWEFHQLNAALPPDADDRKLVVSVYDAAGVHLLASDGHHNRPSLEATSMPRVNRGYFVETVFRTNTLTGFARCRPAPGGSGGGNLVMVRQPTSGAYAPAWALGWRVALIGLILSILSTLPSVFIARRLRRTYHTLEAAADRIASGDSSAILPSGQQFDELSAACGALNRMVAVLRERIARAGEDRVAPPSSTQAPSDNPPPEDSRSRKIYW